MPYKEPPVEHQIKPGEVRNPDGRPKKFVHTVLDDLKKEGYEGIKKTQVEDVYKNMISLSEDKLKEIGLDKEMPMIFRIVAKAILTERGFEVVERMLDRAHGKAKDTVTVEGGLFSGVKKIVFEDATTSPEKQDPETGPEAPQ